MQFESIRIPILIFTSLHVIPITHAPETGAVNRLHFLPYASGMKISGAETKRIKVILYSVYLSSAVHCNGQTIKISIYELGRLLCTFCAVFLSSVHATFWLRVKHF